MLIDITGIHKTYVVGKEEVRALRGVDLQIEKGEYVAIMGPSGSGKSTFMNILGCLDTPSCRQVHAERAPRQRHDRRRVGADPERGIGFVFQTFNSLPRATAAQNVELPHSTRESDGATAARAPPRCSMWSASPTAPATSPSARLGGQRQRVAIARAPTPLTIPSARPADWPSGTDHQRRDHGHPRRAPSKGHTIILVTHELDIAHHAKRVVRLRDGTIETTARSRPDPAAGRGARAAAVAWLLWTGRRVLLPGAGPVLRARADALVHCRSAGLPLDRLRA